MEKHIIKLFSLRIMLMGIMFGACFNATVWSSMGSSSSSSNSSTVSLSSGVSPQLSVSFEEDSKLEGGSKEQEQFLTGLHEALGENESHFITENFTPPHLVVPALSLQRWHRLNEANFCRVIGEGRCPHLVGISEEGSLFFCDPTGNSEESLTRITVFSPQAALAGWPRATYLADMLRNLPTALCDLINEYHRSTRFELIDLQDGWQLIRDRITQWNNIVHYWDNWEHFSYIPVIRPITVALPADTDEEQTGNERQQIDHDNWRELGVLDVNKRSIVSVAIIHKNDTVCAANSKAAIIEMREPDRKKYYELVSNNNAIRLGEATVKTHYSLDPEQGKALFSDSISTVIRDVNNPELCITAPQMNFSTTQYSLNNNGDNNCITYIGKNMVQWRYNERLNSSMLSQGDILDVPHDSPVTINDKNTMATGLWKAGWSHALVGVYRELRPSVTSIVSGKQVMDPDAFKSEGPRNIVTTRNGKYIAARLYHGDVLVWKIRGSDLPGTCTFSDRLALHELDWMYRIGQERNKKYHRNFVIRLNPRQWTKFQELSQRPECEVPSDWARLFRKMQAIHYSGQRSADVVAQNRNS